MRPHFTRREFLKLSALGLAGLALPRTPQMFPLSAFPEGEHLGRVTVAGLPLMSRPTPDSQTIRLLYEDEMIIILRRLLGYQPAHFSQTWIETPEGYV